VKTTHHCDETLLHRVVDIVRSQKVPHEVSNSGKELGQKRRRSTTVATGSGRDTSVHE
jgi:hypothetical protein